MSEAAQSIDLNLVEQLRNDPEFRRAFFRAEMSAEIARQLIELRERRDLTQGELAKLVGTQQPAISRYERADYQNWTITTLRSITDALNGRMRVVIDAAEDVLTEYEDNTERHGEDEKRGDIGLASIEDALRAEEQRLAQQRSEGKQWGSPQPNPYVLDPVKYNQMGGAFPR